MLDRQTRAVAETLDAISAKLHLLSSRKGFFVVRVGWGDGDDFAGVMGVGRTYREAALNAIRPIQGPTVQA